MTLPHRNDVLDERAQFARDFQGIVNEFAEVLGRNYELFDNLVAPKIRRMNNCRVFWASCYPKPMNESVSFRAETINLRKYIVNFIYQVMRCFIVRSNKRLNPTRNRIG